MYTVAIYELASFSKINFKIFRLLLKYYNDS